MGVVHFTALVLAAMFVAPVALGQNLASNPNFDTDVTEWAPFATASIVWNPLDADGAPASGSALVTNLSTTAGDSTGARQCIGGITGGTVYRFAAEILVPGGQSETGRANLLVQWYDQPGCSSGQVGMFLTPWVTDATPDVWHTSSDSAEAPSGAQSARLRLSVLKLEDSGALDAHFDKVVFKEQLFGDGFESGDASAWSSVVGGT